MFLRVIILATVIVISNCNSEKIPGQCGMKGMSVECNRDGDCPRYERCTSLGKCIEEYRECETNRDCEVRYSDSTMFCRDYKCYQGCNSTMDCGYGSKCVDGECLKRWCPVSGSCPEQWEEIEGSLLCRYTMDCTEQGLILGACGLSGECVECFADDHCENGICGLDGTCVQYQCISDDNCDVGQSCYKNRCVTSCGIEEECTWPEVCIAPEGYCVSIRCDSSARCEEEGWWPVQGTLSCEYNPCYGTEMTLGVCAMSKRCVDCVVDEDCSEGEFCDIHGSCTSDPECAPGSILCDGDDLCVDGRCFSKCSSDTDCMSAAGVCQPGGYCHYERCSTDGTCPAGWLPGDVDSVPGTLACVKN